MKKLLLISSILLPLALTSFAASAGGWTEAEKVTLIHPYGNLTAGAATSILIRLENSPADNSGVGFNPDGCSGNFYYSLTSANSAFDVIFAQLLAAQTTDTPIRLYLSGCSGAGSNGWPVILHSQTT